MIDRNILRIVGLITTLNTIAYPRHALLHNNFSEKHLLIL